ncbi:unnamed protein product [Leuciscus chuanchicus]
MHISAYKLSDVPFSSSTWSVFESVNLNTLIETMSRLKPTMCPNDVIPSRFLGQVIETVGSDLLSAWEMTALLLALPVIVHGESLNVAMLQHWSFSPCGRSVQPMWSASGRSLDLPKSSELYPQHEATYNPLVRDITSENVDWFRTALRGTQCGMAWLLSPEPEPRPQHQVNLTVPELVKEHGGRGLEAILASMRLTKDQQATIQTATVGQPLNPQWQLHRQGRLTASNFGTVLLSQRSSTPCPSLMKRVLGGNNLDGVMAVNWGLVNEAERVRAFEKACQLEVLESGLFVSESGILGASPDGLVEPSALLEDKCPHSQRNMTITEAVQSSSFCLRMEGGSYVLKEDHPYWHQVQGQLYITGHELCYFVVWTTKEAIILSILKALPGVEISSSWRTSTPNTCSLCWPVERRTCKYVNV